MKYRIVPILVICLSLLWKCEPCADCGEPVVFDPFISLVFIDYDSLSDLDISLLETNDSLLTLTTLRDSLVDTIGVWNNLLIAYRDSIENGNSDYVDDTVQLDSDISMATADLGEVDTARKYTNVYLTTLQTARTGVNSGKILVDNIELIENQRDTSYFDSTKTYRLPLLMDSDFTSYKITILGESDTLSFSYEREISTNAQRKVRMRVRNIQLVDYTYQEAPVVDCESDDCLDNEVLVTVYF
ncbi:hypothetical protein [Marinoscillum sp. MHG1-6]|uniref:hypothetical protein n=1 Tax=Marinoscillum sp. MHG1-6 TaxID=2959627 RepID=UPI0021576870|nr:hypothetical protein [Marinoscillum sp. MHG1-6]